MALGIGLVEAPCQTPMERCSSVRDRSRCGDDRTMTHQERLGRFPHRNDVLGRISTEDEIALLQDPTGSF
jgi:uncharacterized protein (DUF924 family)